MAGHDQDRHMEAPKGAIRHPSTPNAIYYLDDSGSITVTQGSRWGRFTNWGEHIDGPLFEADPELCVWVGTPRPKGHHRISRVLDATSEH